MQVADIGRMMAEQVSSLELALLRCCTLQGSMHGGPPSPLRLPRFCSWQAGHSQIGSSSESSSAGTASRETSDKLLLLLLLSVWPRPS